MNRIDEIKERAANLKGPLADSWRDDIAYLLRIAEAAEVMRNALCWNLEIFAKSRFLTDKDSNAHKSIIHDSMDEGYRDTEEALAKYEEIKK